MDGNRGFTLVEALVMVAVFGVLALAGTGLGALVADMRGMSASDRLIADIKYARLAAVTHGTAIVLCPRTAADRCRQDAQWSHGWITFLDADGDRQPGSSSEVLQVEQAPPDYLRIETTGGRRELRYLPDGRSAGSNLTFRICAERSNRLLGRVVVNNGGRPRSERAPPDTPCDLAAIQSS